MRAAYGIKNPTVSSSFWLLFLSSLFLNPVNFPTLVFTGGIISVRSLCMFLYLMASFVCQMH